MVLLLLLTQFLAAECRLYEGDVGGQVGRVRGAWVFEGDVGGVVGRISGRFISEGDVGGVVARFSGGGIYEGDVGGLVGEIRGSRIFEGDTGIIQAGRFSGCSGAQAAAGAYLLLLRRH